MPRYDFRSPGADAGNAIQQFLVQRKMEERQRMLDAAAMEKQNADIQRQSEAIAVQRQQVEESARLRELTQTGLDDERLFRRATTSQGLYRRVQWWRPRALRMTISPPMG